MMEVNRQPEICRPLEWQCQCHNKLPCFQEAGQVDFESSFNLCFFFLQVTLYIALAFLLVTAEAPF